MRLRVPAALATTLVLVTMLGGCFVLPVSPPGPPTNPTSTSEADAEPEKYIDYGQVGDCWVAQFRQVSMWTTWHGDAPVDCGEAHQLYTFHLGELAVAPEEPYDGSSATPDMVAAARDYCMVAFLAEYGADSTPGLLTSVSMPPAPEEWDAGERRIRCDIATFMVGDDFLYPELGDLADAAGLPDAIAAGDYDLCLTGEGYYPYDGDATVIVDCDDEEYYWRLDSIAHYEADMLAAYPGDQVLDDYAWEHCDESRARDDEEIFYYPVVEEGWDYGARTSECWFSTIGLA